MAGAANHFGAYFTASASPLWMVDAAGLTALAALSASAVVMFRSAEHSGSSTLIRRLLLFVVLLILFAWVAGIGRPRHIMPWWFAVPACFAVMARAGDLARRTAMAAMLLLCVLNATLWMQEWGRRPFDPVPVAAALRAEGISTFYGSYWTTYPIWFASDGSVRGAPLLRPFGDIVSDRTPVVTEAIRRDGRAGFVFGDGEVHLLEGLRAFCRGNAIAWRERSVGGTTIAFAFGRQIIPVSEGQGTAFRLGDGR
jgi:hypothetical protein